MASTVCNVCVRVGGGVQPCKHKHQHANNALNHAHIFSCVCDNDPKVCWVYVRYIYSLVTRRDAMQTFV